MEINGNTKLVGIIGDPVSHSLSPRMQNAAFAAMGLDMCYVPLLVAPDHLHDAIWGLKAMHFLGANVTIPHKVAAAKLMDKLADSARMTGSVNTIVNREGRLEGHNTDGFGFIRSLEEHFKVDYKNSPVLIAGAGGAARAVGAALASRGVPQITIINRTEVTATEFKTMLISNFPDIQVSVLNPDDDYGDLVSSSRLVINATPLGMEGSLKRVSLRVDKLSGKHVVCDIVYTKSQETPLLVAAKEKGASVLGGLGMLLHQGAEAIHLWTGLQPPIEIMRHILES